MSSRVSEVEMLCWFDRQGNANPIRFQMKNQDQENQVICIDHIKKRELEKLAGNRMIVFTCMVSYGGLLQEIKLKYEIDSCKWLLFP